MEPNEPTNYPLHYDYTPHPIWMDWGMTLEEYERRRLDADMIDLITCLTVYFRPRLIL